MSSTPPRRPGIYLVTLTNSDPFSVNANRLRIADCCIKVTSANCKVGKAQNLAARERDYQKTFGAGNVRFEVLAVIENPGPAELAILNKVRQYRIRGQAGRLNEWLQEISADEVRLIVRDVVQSFDIAGPSTKGGKAGFVTQRRRTALKQRPDNLDGGTVEGSDPAETVRLLTRLRQLGFTDKQFSVIHHFADEKIDNHLKYCQKTQQFRAGSNNIKVQLRLRYVFEATTAQSDFPNQTDEQELNRLACEAVLKWP